jgi:SAM-dependent methyltransferase
MVSLPLDSFDEARAEEFGGRMVRLLNESSLSLLISIGHQTALFDTLAGLPPSSSARIASAAGLEERYVREWLGGMVTGGIVEYDPESSQYSLPAEHAISLTRASGTNNLAFFTQYIPVLAGVEPEIVRCFRQGGGVPYAAFPRFQAVQGEETRALYDETLLSRTIPAVPGLREKLAEGILVADIGCGQGHAVNLLAAAFPRSSFTGYDFSKDAIAAARAEAKQMGLDNARFEVRDVSTVGAREEFDLITAFDAIHDQKAPATVLGNIHRALKEDGIFLMADIEASSHLHENAEHPFGPLLYAISTLHCMTVSLALGGEGLGTVWGEQKALEYLAEAGFGEVERRKIEGDALNVYFIARKS